MSQEVSVVFVLGAPGAGKGTLGTQLTQKFPVQHISAGELLRRVKDDSTHPKSELIRAKLQKQELLGSDVLVPIIQGEIEELLLKEPGKKVVLVDGYPRNLEQKVEFEKYLKPRLVLFFNCPKEIALQRYLARNSQGRETDDEALFEIRYAQYLRENEDIEREYRERGVLVEIDVSQKREETWELLCEILEKDERWMG